MDPTTLTSQTVHIGVYGTSTVLPATLTYSSINNSLTIQPVSDLPGDSPIYVNLDSTSIFSSGGTELDLQANINTNSVLFSGPSAGAPPATPPVQPSLGSSAPTSPASPPAGGTSQMLGYHYQWGDVNSMDSGCTVQLTYTGPAAPPPETLPANSAALQTADRKVPSGTTISIEPSFVQGTDLNKTNYEQNEALVRVTLPPATPPVDPSNIPAAFLDVPASGHDNYKCMGQPGSTIIPVTTGTADGSGGYSGPAEKLVIGPIQFKLMNDVYVFDGWDGPSSSLDKHTWTKVGVGQTNDFVTVVLPVPSSVSPSDIECVANDSDGHSTGQVGVAINTLFGTYPKGIGLDGGENEMNITGKQATVLKLANDNLSTTSTPATVVVRQQSTKQVLSTLNVNVYAPQTFTIDIFYAFDPANRNSTLPYSFPQSASDTATAKISASNIVDNLNTAYFQANVSFTLGNVYIMTPGNPSEITSSLFDSTTGTVSFPYRANDNAMGNLSIVDNAELDIDKTGRLSICVLKGLNATGGSPFGYDGVSIVHHSYVTAYPGNYSDPHFPPFQFYVECTHELGRPFNLSTVAPVNGYGWDPGPWPIEFMDDSFNIANQAGVMAEYCNTLWIRHEDCQQVSEFGAGLTH